MGQYEKHVFVCTTGKVCPRQGALEVIDILRRNVKSAGLADRIRINKSGCMSQCGYGPMVVVYPEDVWYCAVRPEDAERIFEEHLVGGRPHVSTLYRGETPGKRICPRGEEPIPPVDPPNPK